MKKFDRRIIYLILLLAIAIPKIFEITVPTVRFKVAERTFDLIEKIKVEPGKIFFISLDFGPSTLGENRPQSEIVIEHLMRKRQPFVVFSQYHLSKVFLDEIPQKVAAKLNKEASGKEKWKYGSDWVNLGYRPGDSLLLQAMAKSDDLLKNWVTDTRGNRLQDLEALKGVKGFESISHIVQITGLTATLDRFINFFKTEKHRPIFIHGCTSITIPQAFIFLDSGQLNGLFEGVAGAAWYAEKVKAHYKLISKSDLEVTNTMISTAHMVLIFFIILGNLFFIFKKIKGS